MLKTSNNSKKRKNKRPFAPRIAVGILGIGVIIVALLYIFFNTKKAEARWFDDAWLYRARISVSNTGSTVTNQKVKLDIDTASLITANKLQNDCGDSRFTDAGGKTLKYYIDSTGGACNTSSTDYYVLVDNIPAGTFAIYHYYGNSVISNGTESAQFSESTFTPGGTPSTGSEEKSPSPVAYWSLDEGYGTTANSYPGNYHSGSISGAVWQSESQCVKGRCLYFDGSNDYITVADHSNLDFTNNLTMQAWVKPYSIDSAGTWDRILSKGGVIDLAVTTNSSIGFVFRLNDGSNRDVQSGVIPELNKWVHVAVTYDGSNVRFYIDGRLRYTSSSYTYSALNSSNPFTIGNIHGGGSYDRPFHGNIDEPRVYNYARSASQIRADYNAGGSSLGATGQITNTQASANLSDGLVGYWKFDEASWNGTSGEVIDSSGTGDNGTAECDNTYDTCASGVPTTGLGKFNRGGVFNQDGQRIYINNTDFGGDDKFESESIWFKADTLPSSGSRMQIWSHVSTYDATGSNSTVATHNRNPLWINSSGQIIFNALTYSGTYQCSDWTIGQYLNRTLTSSSSITTGSWNHFAYTIDWGSQNEIKIKIYLNGKLEGEYSEGDRSCSSNNYHTWLGKAKGTSASYIDFDGNLDEYRRYKRILSPAEVSALYEWGPDPLARWALDENTGTAVNDVSGNGYSGTFSGAPTWTVGKVGGGLDFDGTDDAIDFTDVNVFEFTGNFTVAAWINVDSFATQPSIISKGSGSSAGWNLKLSSGGVLQLQTNSTTVSGGTTLSTGTWYHVAASVGSSGVVSLYVNGKLDNTPSSRTFTTNSSALLAVGSNHNGSAYGNYMDGRIDDISVYNYPLTSRQVVNLMNGGNVNDRAIGSPIGHPVGYWKFDEGYGTTTYDSSVNLNNATLSNMASPSTSTSGWSNDGKFGKALSFDGVNDSVSIADISGVTDFAYNEEFTISIWVKIPATQSNTSIITNSIMEKWSGGGGYPYVIRLYNQTGGSESHKVQVARYDGTNAPFMRSTKTYNDNSWHHVLFTKRGNMLYLYMDGEFDTSTADTTTGTTTNSSALYLGTRGGANFPFKGQIDEFKIYNYGLSDSEINLEYNQGKSVIFGSTSTTSAGTVADNSQSRSYCVPGSTATCNPPIAELKFDEGTGTSAYDTSGNANVGTLTAGPTWVEGKYGSAVNFDGSDDIVNINSVSSTSKTYTISLWAKSSKADDTFDYLFDSVNGRLVLGWFASISGNIGFYDGSWKNFGDAPNDGKWHNIVYLFNNTSSTASLYIDGKKFGSDLSYTGVNIGTTTAIGHHYAGGVTSTGPFEGSIDNFKIYDYIRTPAQIAWEYNNGAPSVWYKFDECQGSIIYDWAPNANGEFNGNNGTLTVGGSGSNTSVGTCAGSSGEAWADGATGKLNSSLEFDGTDDNVAITNSNFAVGTGDFSYAMWIKLTNASTTNNRVFSAGGNAYTYEMWVDSVQRVAAHAGDASGARSIANTPSETFLSTGVWYHVAAVYDRDTDLKVYINGKLAATQTGITSYSSVDYNSSVGEIGGYSGATTFNFDGSIDDFRFYNYTLNPTQINTIYNDGAVNFK